MMQKHLIDQIKKIKLLILDVDGVLTDGKIWFSPEGHEYKAFHSQDGHGIKYLQQYGIKVAIISGRYSSVVTRRAKELQINYVYQKQSDKIQALNELMTHCNIDLTQIAYVGDDLLDLPIMRKIGFPIAVNNAVKEVQDIASWKTSKNGGEGAVREICDFIIHCQMDL